MNWLKQNWIFASIIIIALVGLNIIVLKNNDTQVASIIETPIIPTPSSARTQTPYSTPDPKDTPICSGGDAVNFADEISDYTSLLGIKPVAPSVGFETGLTSYPRLTWGTKTVSENKCLTSINMEYPEFVGGAPVLKLNQYISNVIQERVVIDRESQKEGNPNDWQSTLLDVASRYRIIGVMNGIVSMEIVIADYTGGGNGNHTEPIVINWDLKTNSMLNAGQLFCSGNYKDMLAPIIRRHLVADFEKVFNYHPLPDDMIQWINDGTSASGANREYFLLRAGGLVVVFPPYQVMSGNSGIVRTFIPSKEIPNMLCLP